MKTKRWKPKDGETVYYVGLPIIQGTGPFTIEYPIFKTFKAAEAMRRKILKVMKNG